MNLPKFPNIDLLVKKANTGASPSINVTREEAQHIAKEYMNLVTHIMQLQDRIIELENEKVNPETVEIITPNF
tara:strand:+ start:143 stop:361 length:219 start_codon:yes stop_codon:yes gene_type:complete